MRLRTSLREGDGVKIPSGGFKIGFARIVSVKSKSISELTDGDARKDVFEKQARAFEGTTASLRAAKKCTSWDLKPLTGKI